MIVTDLVERYGQSDLTSAACVVAVGGDGTTLRALDAVLPKPGVPVFSMRVPGSVAALGNALDLDGLVERLPRCRRVTIRPLEFEARTMGSVIVGHAINEVAIVRRRFQAARMRIRVGTDTVALFGDGIVIASPVGSTGYCLSLGGPRLPLDAALLALAGIAIRSPAEGFRAVTSAETAVQVEITDPVFRPMQIETHSAVVPDVCEVAVRCSRNLALTLLIDPGDDVIPMGSIPMTLLAGGLSGLGDAQ